MGKKFVARAAHILYNDFMKIEEAVAKALIKKRKTIAVAESCTGGLISSRLTDISGSSSYFQLGVVSYSNESKENLLGVAKGLIRKYGAVSRQAALEMAAGVKRAANVDIGIGVTGIAGPTGGTIKKPVGLVYIAFVSGKKTITREYRFKGSREEIKFQATQEALDLILCNV